MVVQLNYNYDSVSGQSIMPLRLTTSCLYLNLVQRI